MKSFANGAKERLFEPCSDPTQPTAAIESYLGSYTHPSYGTITLTEHIGSNSLRGSFPGRTTLDPFDFEHIDGDVFLAKADIISLIPVRAKATFSVDNRNASKLGVEFSAGLVTWFVKDDGEV